MKLREVYKSNSPAISFELFPPKTEAGLRALYEHTTALLEHQPAYMTCTYGAGGSTQDKTLEIISAVKQRFTLPVASHLTCVGATEAELRSYLQRASEAGVDYIVALRGDPPQGQQSFKPIAGGFRYANELVSMIRQDFPQFGIAVAGYPEKHQEALSLEADLDNLKRKVDCGADAVITQLFYDNDDLYRFIDRASAIGINVPIIPGLLPVTNLSQIQRITSLCGARLPAEFVAKLGEHEDDAWQFEVGVEFAIRQVQALIDYGVQGIHFYVLNKSNATCRLLEAVGV